MCRAAVPCSQPPYILLHMARIVFCWLAGTRLRAVSRLLCSYVSYLLNVRTHSCAGHHRRGCCQGLMGRAGNAGCVPSSPGACGFLAVCPFLFGNECAWWRNAAELLTSCCAMPAVFHCAVLCYACVGLHHIVAFAYWPIGLLLFCVGGFSLLCSERTCVRHASVGVRLKRVISRLLQPPDLDPEGSVCIAAGLPQQQQRLRTDAGAFAAAVTCSSRVCAAACKVGCCAALAAGTPESEN